MSKEMMQEMKSKRETEIKENTENVTNSKWMGT
jgi:hypothetical protein